MTGSVVMIGAGLTIDPLAANGLALFLGGVFVAAAVHKGRDFSAFQNTVRAYQIVPPVLVKPVARALPLVEAVSGLGVLWPATRPIAALVLAALLLIYALAIGRNLARGRLDFDCGCHWGGGSPGRARIGSWMLGRNALLIALCGVVSLPMTPRAEHWMDWPLGVALALLCALLYGTVEQLAANQTQTSMVRGRHA